MSTVMNHAPQPPRSPASRPRLTPGDLAAAAGARRGVRRSRRAFTLLEMLVAVGAVALLALGISQVFRATNATLTGGKRLNRFNDYAARLERQMREDFGSMTRDGFLVIRSSLANIRNGEGEPVLLYKDQPVTSPGQPARPGEQRRRRVDQIIFFANGRFTTLRDPFVSDRVATSNTARIYYGHGLRWNPETPGYYDPVDVTNTGSDTSLPTTPYDLGRDRPDNPNRYAKDWILLRHVTLLAQPSKVLIDPPVAFRNFPAINLFAAEWPDSDIQIALQPAASDIFRNLAEVYPVAGAIPDGELARDGGTDINPPRFGSGVVDIATTDLSEIRATVLSGIDPSTVVGGPFVPGSARYESPPGTQTNYMQMWMREAFPAGHDDGLPASLINPELKGGRMRCEPAAPNLLGLGPNWPGTPVEYKRADQLMLSASNFVPGCSEFIVEWSFGKTYPIDDPVNIHNRGEIIWHGLDRWDDLDNDNVHDPNERWFARPYDPTDPNTPFAQVTQKVDLRDANAPPHPPHLVHQNLIHTVTPNELAPTPRSRLYSYFGYVDPTFTPDLSGGDDNNDNDYFNEPTDAVRNTMPWAWPTMIRVTMTLVDPADPTIEQTYQFVFKTPGNPDAPLN